jgi:hypothetical protein
MKKWIAILSVFLFSCGGKSIQSQLKGVNSMEIVDTQTNFSFTETRTEIVQGFIDVMNEQGETVDCTPQGNILFKKGKEMVLRAGYFKDATACNYLIIENGNKKTGYRLSNNALMYLGVYFQVLKNEQKRKYH